MLRRPLVSFCASVDLAPFELLSCPLNGAPFPAERRQKKDRKQLAQVHAHERAPF